MCDSEKRSFVCAVCQHEYYADAAKDAECEAEFISRYGHKPEATVDDELVSLCDWCNEEFERRRAASLNT